MSVFKITAQTATVAALLALGASSAQAVPRKVHNMCKSDYKRLCPRYPLESTQLRACMEANSLQISSGCVDALVDAGYVDKRRVRR